MSVSSEVLARLRGLGGLLGITNAGKRDIYSTFGYLTTVTYTDAVLRYSRHDISSRVIDAEPRAIWSNPPKVDSSTAFMEAWQNLVIRHNLYSRLEQLDRLAGLGRFAIMLIGFDDGKDLSQPVVKSSEASTNITFLRAYGEGSVEITKFEEDGSSPRYGLPVEYKISTNMDNLSVATSTSSIRKKDSGISVHYTRILHVAENILENDIYGYPRMFRTYNLLQDIEKISGSSAETFWLTANRGMQLDVDKDMMLSEADAADLSDEIDEYENGLRRVMRTKGVTVKPLGSDMADPRGVFAVLTSLLAGTTGIPQRILLGSEAGQLASEQDRANWATRIESRRTLFIEPHMLNPLTKRLINVGVLPVPDTLKWDWPEAFRQSPLERSQTSAQQARTLANVSKALSSETPVVTPDEGRRIIESAGSMPLFNDKGDTLPLDE